MKRKLVSTVLIFSFVFTGCGGDIKITESFLATEMELRAEPMVLETEWIAETAEEEQKTEIADVSDKYLSNDMDMANAVIETENENAEVVENDENGNPISGGSALASTSESYPEPIPVPDVGSEYEGNNEENWDLSDWNDFEGGGLGTGKPTTDGYGGGVEIEIGPTP